LGTISAFAFRHRKTKSTGKRRAQGNEGHRETKGTGKRRAQGNEGHRETKGTGKPRAQENEGTFITAVYLS